MIGGVGFQHPARYNGQPAVVDMIDSAPEDRSGALPVECHFAHRACFDEDFVENFRSRLAPVVEIARNDHGAVVFIEHRGQPVQLRLERRRTPCEIDCMDVPDQKRLGAPLERISRDQRGFGQRKQR